MGIPKYLGHFRLNKTSKMSSCSKVKARLKISFVGNAYAFSVRSYSIEHRNVDKFMDSVSSLSRYAACKLSMTV